MLAAVAADDQSWEPEESLAELERLADTAGVEVVGKTIQNLRHPQPVTYLGKGKLTELKELKSPLRYDTIITDDELSPAQQRHLEDALDVQAIDRTALILDIFAHHARTREGRLQVELAQYRYRLPRLTGRGIELSRLGAGINTRGPGETKLESDRRRIRRRISELGREIEQVRSQRAGQRRQRRLSGIPVVALVGYTNAGKSTLMNALTGAEVWSSDQLFATLDPTTRRVELEDGQEILLTDTVGFIQKLPTDLIAAFRATLEEITEADLILHVVDISHPQMDEQAEAVEDELEDLGIGDRRRLVALNKADLAPEERIARANRTFPDAVVISATTGSGLGKLRGRITADIGAEYVPVRVSIPYTQAGLVTLFRSRGVVEREDHEPSATVIVGKLPADLVASFRPFFA